MRIKIVLECEECHARNYTQSKNKQEHPERIQVKKFCPRCNRHTIHRESR